MECYTGYAQEGFNPKLLEEHRIEASFVDSISLNDPDEKFSTFFNIEY